MHDAHKLISLYGHDNPKFEYIEQKAIGKGPTYYHCKQCNFKNTNKQGVNTNITKKHKGRIPYQIQNDCENKKMQTL